MSKLTVPTNGSQRVSSWLSPFILASVAFSGCERDEAGSAKASNFREYSAEESFTRYTLEQPVTGTIELVRLHVGPWPGIYERLRSISKEPSSEIACNAWMDGTTLNIQIIEDMFAVQSKDRRYYLYGVSWAGYGTMNLWTEDGECISLCGFPSDSELEFPGRHNNGWDWTEEMYPETSFKGKIHSIELPWTFFGLGTKM